MFSLLMTETATVKRGEAVELDPRLDEALPEISFASFMMETVCDPVIPAAAGIGLIAEPVKVDDAPAGTGKDIPGGADVLSDREPGAIGVRETATTSERGAFQSDASGQAARGNGIGQSSHGGAPLVVVPAQQALASASGAQQVEGLTDQNGAIRLRSEQAGSPAKNGTAAHPPFGNGSNVTAAPPLQLPTAPLLAKENATTSGSGGRRDRVIAEQPLALTTTTATATHSPISHPYYQAGPNFIAQAALLENSVKPSVSRQEALGDISADLLVNSESRPVAPQTGSPHTQSSQNAAEPARQVAQQLAQAVTQSQGRATEISLNPEELGRVRLSLSAHEGSVTLNLMAERPETQDLMRRHIDALMQEFRDLGYSDINFSFSNGREQEPTQNELINMDEKQIAEVHISEPQKTDIEGDTGLDLRL